MTLRLFGVLAIAAGLLLDPSWHPPSQPPRRAHHALVYDASRHVVLLSGGSTPLEDGARFEFFSDVWALTPAGWSLVSDVGDRRSGFAMAYDPERQQVWSFGGYDGKEALGDLRILGPQGWRAAGQHPSLVAAEPGFVFDAARHRFVLFGGSGRPGDPNDHTWEYDGRTWHETVANGNPPPRQAHALVYDARRRVTVLFGGMAAGGSGQPPKPLGDTWEYDGGGWHRLDVPGPAARFSAGATYNSRRGQVVLFGGLGEAGFLGDTWTWDGRAWRQVDSTGPAPRAMGYVTYDARRDRVVLFGGRKGWPNGDLDDTWEWDGVRWTATAPGEVLR